MGRKKEKARKGWAYYFVRTFLYQVTQPRGRKLCVRTGKHRLSQIIFLGRYVSHMGAQAGAGELRLHFIIKLLLRKSGEKGKESIAKIECATRPALFVRTFCSGVGYMNYLATGGWRKTWGHQQMVVLPWHRPTSQSNWHGCAVNFKSPNGRSREVGKVVYWVLFIYLVQICSKHS
jgi:hypothetical protein